MKIFRLIHKWVGLIIGIFFFCSCFSGVFILIGRLTGSYAPIFGWMKTLHRTLFLEDAGSMIIGIATLLLIVELISGYFLWWKVANGQIKVGKKKGKGVPGGLRRSLSWTLPSKRRGFHIAGGFWSGIPLMLMALTGLTWSFGWYSTLFYGLFDTGGSGNLFHTIAALHTGNSLGVWSKIIWLIAAILGTSLPITGLMIYLKKQGFRKRGRL